jgi:hypothetical protein
VIRSRKLKLKKIVCRDVRHHPTFRRLQWALPTQAGLSRSAAVGQANAVPELSVSWISYHAAGITDCAT